MTLSRKHFKYLIAVFFNIFLVAILLLWIIKNIHPQSLTHDLLGISITSIFLVIGLDLFVSLLYGLRLKQLLGANYLRAWFIVCIGNGLNSILPFRLGDVIRIYCAKQYYNIQIDKMIGATVVERSFDLFILLSIGIIAFLTGPVPFALTFRYALLFLFGCSLVVIGLYYILISSNGLTRKFMNRFRIISVVTHCMTDVMVNKNKKQLMLMSLLIWAGVVMIYASFFKLNILQVNLSWQGAMIMCFITTLAFAIPYVIAGIGIFESAVIYYLINMLHVAPTAAVALALAFHFVFALPQVILMGAIIFCKRVTKIPAP